MIDEAAGLARAVTGRPLLAIVLAFAVFPYATLWLSVRLWPRGHQRRNEYLAEYDAVPWYYRPLWVGDVAIRSLLDGLAERLAIRRTARFASLSGGPARRRSRPIGGRTVGSQLDHRHVRKGDLVACWDVRMVEGKPVEMVAVVLTYRSVDPRLVVAKRNGADRWEITHNVAPTPEAVGAFRRQATRSLPNPPPGALAWWPSRWRGRRWRAAG